MTAAAYLARALRIMQAVADTQEPAIRAAGDAIAGALAAGGRLWTFGTGHSHLLAEELYTRAGGLDGVRAILEPSLMLHEGPDKSSTLERLPGLAAALLSQYDVRAGDVVLVASNSGRNAAPVELAEECVARGATVVAVTSLNHSRSVGSRAPSGRRLFEVADIVVDNCGVPGDAVLDVPGVDERVGATSTAAGALVVQAIACEAAARMVELGHPPAVLRSFNSDAPVGEGAR
ncbi:MAG TPA: sugar isomerase domain-containing protein [Streptosporangiales bacterium]